MEEVELLEKQEEEEEEEEEEGTLGEAVEMVIVIPVGVGAALTTMETTRTMHVVIVRLVMVRSLSHYSEMKKNTCNQM